MEKANIDLHGALSVLERGVWVFKSGVSLIPILHILVIPAGHKTPKLQEAYAAARAACFEHGESGKSYRFVESTYD